MCGEYYPYVGSAATSPRLEKENENGMVSGTEVKVDPEDDQVHTYCTFRSSPFPTQVNFAMGTDRRKAHRGTVCTTVPRCQKKQSRILSSSSETVLKLPK